MTPRISVITLTHNKLEVTARCLRSLLASVGPAWELIVVDNGSNDGTWGWLEAFGRETEQHGVGLSLLRNDSNIGCSTARNQGAAMAVGQRLVFMDNDVALRSRGWLAELDAASQRLPAAAVVGPKLVYPFPPYNIQCAGVALSAHGRVQFRGRGEARDKPEFNHEEEVQSLISACFMVSREAFAQAGGFDEWYNPVEFEDFDLCYRIRNAGGRCYYVPSTEMYHFESVTTQGTAALPNTYLIIRNGMRFKSRWGATLRQEQGPPDDACQWQTVITPSFADIGALPYMDNGSPE